MHLAAENKITYAPNYFLCQCTVKEAGQFPSKTHHTINTHTYDNERETSPIVFNYQVCRCSQCGNEFQTPEQAQHFHDEHQTQILENMGLFDE